MENTHVERRASKPVNVTVRSGRPREYLTEREIDKLIEAAKGNRWGHRDATAILLAYRHGLRASELVALRWDDIDFSTSKLHVRRAKGGTASVHPLRAKELRALRRLLRETPEASGRPTSLCRSGWHRSPWRDISAWSREQERPQASASWSTATCCGTRPATSSPTMATTRARSRITWAIGRLPRPCATPPSRRIDSSTSGRTEEGATRPPTPKLLGGGR
jgi:integrase